MKHVFHILLLMFALVFLNRGGSESLFVEASVTEYSFSAADQPDDFVIRETASSTIISVKPLRGNLKKIAEIVAIKHIIEYTTIPFVLLATGEHVGAIGGREIFKELI